MAHENIFIIDKNATLFSPKTLTPPVKHVITMLQRDMKKVLGNAPALTNNKNKASIIIEYAEAGDLIANSPETFAIRFSSEENNNIMHIIGSDDLGIIYGVLHLSKEYLGIDPFWFWSDMEPVKMDRVQIPVTEFLSPKPRVRYRGWFVNDEVCLLGWTDIYPPPREVWERVFEALLRCGGNMVIPGTDLPRQGKHFEIALEMGLYITHHHAEPLGAEMFLRAYPNEEASYVKNPHLFEKLWREGVEKNKNNKVIWTLGFRGQGDAPFWLNDPSFKTPESRAAMIRKVIDRQYEILCEYVKDPVCAVYLYGETTELYKEGYLKFPEGFIKIWSDNGYGKMVTRRRGSHNPRVPALPTAADSGPHGLYYHATFHDLQASSHLTMLGNSVDLVNDELDSAFNAGADYFLLVNSGNIRPHIYTLDAVQQIWRNGKIDVPKYHNNFMNSYFPSSPSTVGECYKEYFETTIKYGKNQDDKAGDEFYHHPAREIIKHWVKGNDANPDSSLLWAAGNTAFPEQVTWFKNKCSEALVDWETLKSKCENTASLLSGNERIFFEDNLFLQVILHHSGCKGFISLCKSYDAFKENNYPLAFVHATKAMEYYSEGVKAMHNAEHDKWKNFYRADWLTNVKCTIYSLDTLRKYLRMLGDGPSFFAWYKNMIIPETERQIYLENTQRRTLSDDELAECLIKNVYKDILL